MASANKTPFSGLNLWEPDDQPLRVDFNADNQKLDAALGDCDKRLALGQLAGEAALLNQWYTARGKSFFQRDLSNTRSYAENLSTNKRIDFFNTTAGVSIVSNALCFSHNLTYQANNYSNTTTNVSPISTFRMAHNGMIKTIGILMYRGSYSDTTKCTGTVELYRLDENEVPIELLATQTASLSNPTETRVNVNFTFNIELPAGLYGICAVPMTGTRPSSSFTIPVSVSNNEVSLLAGRVRSYEFLGLGVKGAAINNPFIPTVVYTYAGNYDLCLTTKTFNLNTPVRNLSIYALHKDLAETLDVNAVLPDGTRVPLARDAAFGASDSEVERFSGILPDLTAFVLEFVFRYGTPTSGQLLGWFMTL